MNPRIRTHVTVDERGAVAGKVTAHAPYASAGEGGHTPEASTDVAFDELPLTAAPLLDELAALLAKIREAAAERLTVRLGDAVFAARQVAIAKNEIPR